MTDRPQRPTDPDAIDPATDALEVDEALEGEVETETLSEELEAMGVEPVTDEELTEEEADAEEAAVAAGVPPVEARAQTTGRRIGLRRTPSRALTPSEQAVHINEPWSRIFVLATVGVFALILLNALLLGKGGLITGTPTPAPSASASAAPSPRASASPAASASASASAGPSTSASPAGSGSAGSSPSASASAAPSASASAAASGSPAASPAPSQ